MSDTSAIRYALNGHVDKKNQGDSGTLRATLDDLQYNVRDQIYNLPYPEKKYTPTATAPTTATTPTTAPTPAFSHPDTAPLPSTAPSTGNWFGDLVSNAANTLNGANTANMQNQQSGIQTVQGLGITDPTATGILGGVLGAGQSLLQGVGSIATALGADKIPGLLNASDEAMVRAQSINRGQLPQNYVPFTEQIANAAGMYNENIANPIAGMGGRLLESMGQSNPFFGNQTGGVLGGTDVSSFAPGERSQTAAGSLTAAVEKGDMAGGLNAALNTIKQYGAEYYDKVDPVEALALSLILDPINFLPGLGIGHAQQAGKLTELTRGVERIGAAGELLSKNKFTTPLAKTIEAVRSGFNEVSRRASFGTTIDEVLNPAKVFLAGGKDEAAFKAIVSTAADLTSVPAQRGMRYIQGAEPLITAIEDGFRGVERGLQTGEDMSKLPTTFANFAKDVKAGLIKDGAEGTVAEQLLEVTKAELRDKLQEHMAQVGSKLHPIKQLSAPTNIASRFMNNLKGFEALAYIGLSPVTFVKNVVNGLSTMALEGLNPLFDAEARISQLRKLGQVERANELRSALNYHKASLQIGGAVRQAYGEGRFATAQTGAFGSFMSRMMDKTKLGTPLKWYEKIESGMRQNVYLQTYDRAISHIYDVGKGIPPMDAGTSAVLHQYRVEEQPIYNILKEVGPENPSQMMRNVADFMDGKRGAAIDWAQVAQEMGIPEAELTAAMDIQDKAEAARRFQEIAARVANGEDKAAVVEEVVADMAHDYTQKTAERIGVDIGAKVAPEERLAQIEARAQEIDAAQVELRAGKKNIPKVNRSAYDDLEGELNALQNERTAIQEQLGYSDEEILFGKKAAPPPIPTQPTTAVLNDNRLYKFIDDLSDEELTRMAQKSGIKTTDTRGQFDAPTIRYELKDRLKRNQFLNNQKTPPEAPAAPVVEPKPPTQPPNAPSAPAAPPVPAAPAFNLEQVKQRAVALTQPTYKADLVREWNALFHEGEPNAEFAQRAISKMTPERLQQEGASIIERARAKGQTWVDTMANMYEDLAHFVIDQQRKGNPSYIGEYWDNRVANGDALTKLLRGGENGFDWNKFEQPFEYRPKETFAQYRARTTGEPAVARGTESGGAVVGAEGAGAGRRPTGSVETGAAGGVNAVAPEVKAVAEAPVGKDWRAINAEDASRMEAATKMPRGEYPPQLSQNVADAATELKYELREGQPGARHHYTNLDEGINQAMAIGTSNPDWYSELYATYKVNKPAAMKALDKIIADMGKDKGVNVERMKEVILERLAKGLDTPVGRMPPDEEARALLGRGKTAAAPVVETPKVAPRLEQARQELAQVEKTIAESDQADNMYYKSRDKLRKEIARLEKQGSGRVAEEIPADQVFNEQGLVDEMVKRDNALREIEKLREVAKEDEAATTILSRDEMVKAKARTQADVYEALYNLWNREDVQRVRLGSDAKNRVMAWMRRDVLGGADDSRKAAHVIADWMDNAVMISRDGETVFDAALGVLSPFQFWRTRFALQSLRRVADKPARLAWYLKARKGVDEITNDPRFPKRLHGKVQLPWAFLPAWAGGGMWFDPMETALSIKQVFNLDQMPNDVTDQDVAASIRALAEQGRISLSEASNAIANQQGALWEQTKQRLTELASTNEGPDDFAGMFRPHLPLDILWKLKTGNASDIGVLFPLTRIIRAATGVNVEQPLKAGLRALTGNNQIPDWDQWEAYRTDRALADMVADGVVSERDAMLAMIERRGTFYEQAQARAQQQMQFQTFSVFGGQLFPKGEQAYYKASVYRNQLIDQSVAQLGGDPSTMSYGEKMDVIKANGLNKKGTPLGDFYDDHPEWTSRQDAFAEPEQRMKGFLTDEMWTRYNSLSALDKRLSKEKMPELKAFINDPKREYTNVTIDKMGEWVKYLRGYLPASKISPTVGAVPPLTYASTDQSNRYQNIQDQQAKYFNLDAMQPKLDTYGTLSTNDKRGYRAANPDVDAYFKWYGAMMKANPDLDALLHPDRTPYNYAVNTQAGTNAVIRQVQSNLNYMARKIGDDTARRFHAHGGTASGKPQPLSLKAKQALAARKANSKYFIPKDVFTELLNLFKANNGGFNNFQQWLAYMVARGAV